MEATMWRFALGRTVSRLVLGPTIVVLGAALLVGCGSEHSKQLAAVAAGPGAGANTSTPFQAAMLEDGKVSYEEYKRAIRAVLGCLRAGAVRVVVKERPVPAARELQYSWWVQGYSHDYRRANALARRRFNRCRREFGDEVTRRYNNQRVIPRQERPAVLVKIVSCARAAGIKISNRPSSHELFEILAGDRKDRGVHCLDRYADYFRTPAR
jgi:hypothetical protein